MIAFNFLFANDPSTGEGEARKISVVAQSEEEAWQSIANQLNTSIEQLKNLTPTIQMKYIRPGEIIVSSQTDVMSDPNDPWPQIVSGGVRDVTDAIRETVSTAQKEKTKIELEGIKIDRFLMNVFSTALLGSLAFSFYLIAIDKQEPVFNFLFPIITAVIGLISGYFAGKSSGGRSKN